MENKKVTTVIIDDDKTAIKQLMEELRSFDEIVVVKTCTNPQKASKIILETKPDLLFLDVEMPGKTGFEVLKEIKADDCFNPTVVFHTSYDKYVLQALRESAFDFLVKPAQYTELCNLINRFRKERYAQNQNYREKLNAILPKGNGRVFIPTPTGLRLFYKDELVLFAYQNEQLDNAGWCVLHLDQRKIKIRNKTTAKTIYATLNDPIFFKVNQSTILNLSFLSAIEYQSRKCILIPPFDQYDITLSRSAFNELKESFDIL